MSKTCRECGAKCCRYFCFEIDEPDDYEEFEDIRWYLLHEGVSVHIEDNDDWYMTIANRCKALASDNRCTIYDDRPKICRAYSHETCDHVGGDYEYKEVFNRPEEIERYARNALGTDKFEARRAKMKGVKPPAKLRKRPKPKATAAADAGQGKAQARRPGQ